MPRNQEGGDLLIPVWWKDENGHICFGGIVIQLKNCINHQDMKEVGYKMHPGFVFGKCDSLKALEYINIVMELSLARDEGVSDATRRKKVQVVQMTVAIDSDGKTTVGASTSATPLVLEKSQLESRKYSLVRFKGLKSFSFVRDNEPLHAALNDLLLGPCNANRWVEVNCKGSDTEPTYDYDMSLMIPSEPR